MYPNYNFELTLLFCYFYQEISDISENSPAWRAREHIRKGDLLVHIQVRG